jgi:hypothetical protein
LTNNKGLYNIEKLLIIAEGIYKIRASFCKQSWPEFINYVEIGEKLIKSITNITSVSTTTDNTDGDVDVYFGLVDVYRNELEHCKWCISIYIYIYIYISKQYLSINLSNYLSIYIYI